MTAWAGVSCCPAPRCCQHDSCSVSSARQYRSQASRCLKPAAILGQGTRLQVDQTGLLRLNPHGAPRQKNLRFVPLSLPERPHTIVPPPPPPLPLTRAR